MPHRDLKRECFLNQQSIATEKLFNGVTELHTSTVTTRTHHELR